MNKKSWVTVLIIVAILAFSGYIIVKKNGNTDENLVKCISSKSVLYMQTGCFACKKQEDLFGENYKYLKIVNCALDIDECLKEEITATPTWIINGEKYVGVQKIDKLKELTGC